MKRNRLSAICILLILAAAASCKKASDSRPAPDAGDPTLQAISLKTGFSQWPKEENGMLVFNSEAHFEKYIAFLDAAVDPKNYDSVRTNDKGDTLEFDQDQVLEDIEAALGFTSVRKITHDHFLKLNEVGWDRLEDIPEEHFIRDAVMRSVLNSDLSVKIGGNFVHVINRSLSVQVDVSQAELLHTFGELPESATLQDVLLIDPTRQYSKVFETDGAGVFSTFGKTPGAAHTLGAAGDVTIIKPKVATPDCNNPRKVVFSDMRMYQQGQYTSSTQGYLPGSFKVDFGDGTSGTYYTYNQNGIEVCETFEHTYANPGTYTYKIDGTPSSVLAGYTQNLAYMTDDVTVYNTSCKNYNKETTEEFRTVPDGSRAWSGKIMVTIEAVWLSDKMRVIAETGSWIRDGNKWKKSKSEIWHQLHTERRQKNTCIVLGQVDGDGWASNSKHILTHRTDDRYFWNTITTTHGIKYHGQWYSFDKVLKACD